MKYLELSLPTPAENLALDDVLLDEMERSGGKAPEILRIWESPTPFAVVGFANKTAEEVDLDACRQNAVPVLRRTSGGGTVLQGPGCLNYSLIFRAPPFGDKEHPLRNISTTTAYVIGRNATALRELLQDDEITEKGLSDIARGDLKISGNAQRRRRYSILVHGTILLDYDLPLIDRTLAMPKRQPDYRRNRPHLEFIINLSEDKQRIADTLRKAWGAQETLGEIPHDDVANLARTQFERPEFTFRF